MSLPRQREVQRNRGLKFLLSFWVRLIAPRTPPTHSACNVLSRIYSKTNGAAEKEKKTHVFQCNQLICDALVLLQTFLQISIIC